MSFLLPTVDFADTNTCMLEPDALSPALICMLGLTDEPTFPIYALWGGSDSCVDRLLSAVADEAANRSLPTFACRSPVPPHLRSALWIEGVGLLRKVDTALPRGCKLIDLSTLDRSSTHEDCEKLALLRAREKALCGECAKLGSASAKLEDAALSLLSPWHMNDALAQKAARIAAKTAVGKGRTAALPITVVTAEGERLRMLPFGEEVQIVGLQALYGVAARFLSLLSDALIERGADSVALLDLWSGETLGIWLPASRICYLIDPPERRQKLMTLSRYLISRPQAIRSRYRVLEGARGAIGQHLAYLTGEIALIRAQIGEIEEKALQKSRFGEFRKRLLIELFCR